MAKDGMVRWRAFGAMSRANATAHVPVRQAAPLFAALGDETRLKILARLSANGPSCIARLHETSDVTRQAVTKHLEVLSVVGLVRSSRRGRERIWELEQRRLSDAHDYLERISRQWDVVLERLRSFVEDSGASDKPKRS
jgi:DNA-binding transcriptional ArsR family regulator